MNLKLGDLVVPNEIAQKRFGYMGLLFDIAEVTEIVDENDVMLGSIRESDAVPHKGPWGERFLTAIG